VVSVSIDFIELRKEPRAVAQRTVCIACDGPAQTGSRLEGVVVDHGPGGAGLLMSHPYTLNRVLTLEGLHADGARSAHVRWVRRTRTQYRVGVEFVGV